MSLSLTWVKLSANLQKEVGCKKDGRKVPRVLLMAASSSDVPPLMGNMENGRNMHIRAPPPNRIFSNNAPKRGKVTSLESLPELSIADLTICVELLLLLIRKL